MHTWLCITAEINRIYIRYLMSMYIPYGFVGSILALCCLSAKTKTLTVLLHGPGSTVADCCATMAHKPDDLQTMPNKLSDSSKLFGPIVSL